MPRPPSHVMTITVPIYGNDCTTVRARVSNRKGYVGEDIPRAVREAVTQALWRAFPPPGYVEPEVGRIGVRIKGPRDFQP